MSFLAGSSAPTPLYPLYMAQWGFSQITITFIFSIYALAVLASLLIAGRLSDHVGRRPVLIVATILQMVTMVVFCLADGLGALLVGRVIQGISAGAAVAALGAGLVDIDRVRGTVANASAPAMGTALGGLVAGLAVHFLPWPTHLIYIVLGAIFTLQLVGLVFMRETVSPMAGALASLRPQFAVPPRARAPLMLGVPMFIATWALVGFYASLGPAMIHQVFGFNASLYGGLSLFLLAGMGSMAVLVLRAMTPHRMMLVGTSGLIVGLLIVLASLSLQAAWVFLIGTLVAGVGFGSGFQAAIRLLMPAAEPHQRAGVLSVAYVICYLAMGIPAIGASVAVVEGNGVLTTAREFGVIVIALAAFALLGAQWQRSRMARQDRSAASLA
jgi:predicted MFS family arabinose efflux permease